MKRWFLGAAILLTCSPGLVTEARAGGGVAGGYPMTGGFGGQTSGQGWSGSFGGMMGMTGFNGMGGCCGGMMGMGGASGCCGLGGCGAMMGMCGFNGMTGCCGGMMGMGCCGVFPTAPTQAYSKWTPSPGMLYSYRTLNIQNTPPHDRSLEFILVHYPERPKFFFYYDPVEKSYFGRYRLGAGAADSFSLLGFADRKANLKDIPESAYRSTGAMPAVPQVIRARPGTTVDAALRNLRLLRPPESMPDELLGLPPEEKLNEKNSPEKKTPHKK
jgi:hypothetical protein